LAEVSRSAHALRVLERAKRLQTKRDVFQICSPNSRRHMDSSQQKSAPPVHDSQTVPLERTGREKEGRLVALPGIEPDADEGSKFADLRRRRRLPQLCQSHHSPKKQSAPAASAPSAIKAPFAPRREATLDT
jgi:hypothetical protein